MLPRESVLVALLVIGGGFLVWAIEGGWRWRP